MILGAQIAAILIFVVMFVLIVTDKIEKHKVTLVCGALTIVVVFGILMRSPDAIFDTLNLKSIITADFWRLASETGVESSGVDWATIFFIAGMMVMVEGMAKSGFFRWLCLNLAKFVKYRVLPIFIVFMIMSAALSMFIDSITVILFLAAVSIELSKLLKFDPVPMIIAEIFCANLGGSATMCGDPPNIIIGSALHLSFFDFLKNTGVFAFICLAIIIFYFYFTCRKELSKKTGQIHIEKIPAPSVAITSRREFAISVIIFAIAIVLLVTHNTTGLTVAFIGLFIAAITLITQGKHALRILKKIDHKLLLFFIGLFITVGGLEQTGILHIIAGFIAKVSGGNLMLMVTIIIWISAVASAFIDNIPFAATMVPIIRSLARLNAGVDLATLAWALSLGTDIGGSATPIGASANVVGISVANRNHHQIGWGRYCRKAAPATIIVLGICTLGMFLRYCR